ncbi:MAG: sodium:calcium antiporter [Nanoarchaeota archaeon]
MLSVGIVEDIIIFLLSLITLIYSGLLVVKSLVKLSYKMHVKEYILSFILLGLSTSIPELFVGITSALQKKPLLSLGNIIGASIMDVTFVSAIGAIIARRIPLKNKMVKSTSIYMVGIVSLMVILALIGNQLSRIDGVILIAVFFFYMSKLYKQKTETKPLGKKTEKKVLEEDHEGDHRKLIVFYKKIRDEVWFNFILFIIGISVVFLSAKLVTNSAVGIANDFSLPVLLVGMIIVSVGTTLPELVLEARISLAKRWNMSFGDLMGSVVVNSSLILGIVSLISPIMIDSILFIFGAMFLIVSTAILAIMMNTKKEITWKDGLILLLVYFIFLIVQLNLRFISSI